MASERSLGCRNLWIKYPILALNAQTSQGPEALGENFAMQDKQSDDGATTQSKSTETEARQAEALQQRLAAARESVKRLSPATRANLSGRFKVN